MFDYCRRRRAARLGVPRMVGLDADASAVAVAVDMGRIWADGTRVEFVQARSEALPLPAQSCDLVIGRLLLPYARIDSTLGEIVRVLKSGGLAFLQAHSPGHYWSELRREKRTPREILYYLRPILSGWFLAWTGRQPRARWFTETALTPGQLDRVCMRAGLVPVWRDVTRPKPMVVCRKKDET